MKKITILMILILGSSLFGNDSITKWDGKYYGISLNYNHGKVDNDSDINAGDYYTGNDIELISEHSDNSNSDNNLGATLSIGYNHQIENIVYGLELDLSLGNYSNEYNSGSIYYDTSPTDTFDIQTKLSHDWIINLQPKIGYSHNSSMYYAVGGLSLAKFNYEFSATDTFAPLDFQQESDKYKLGWNVGVGMEHKINKDWSIQIEYLHTEFNNVAEENSSFKNYSASYSNNVDYKIDNMSIGFIKRF